MQSPQTPIPVTLDQVRRFRLIRSGLLQPFADPQAAAADLMGIQAQILPAAGVALWNRTRGLTHDRFEQLLYDERTLVKLWGQRGTLHLYPSGDWPLVCAMISGAKSWWGRTAEKENRYDDYDRLVESVAIELRRRETMGRSDLRTGDLATPPPTQEGPTVRRRGALCTVCASHQSYTRITELHQLSTHHLHNTLQLRV